MLSGLLELAFPLAVKGLVDMLLPARDWPLILLAAGGLLVIYALNAGLSVIVTYWGHRLGINIETAMRSKAFAHLQTLSFRSYDERKTGHLVPASPRTSRRSARSPITGPRNCSSRS